MFAWSYQLCSEYHGMAINLQTLCVLVQWFGYGWHWCWMTALTALFHGEAVAAGFRCAKLACNRSRVGFDVSVGHRRIRWGWNLDMMEMVWFSGNHRNVITWLLTFSFAGGLTVSVLIRQHWIKFHLKFAFVGEFNSFKVKPNILDSSH